MSDKIQELRELIRENRFAEARKLLKTMNHPKKAEWLAKLDEREAAYNDPLPPLELKSSKTSTHTIKAIDDSENAPKSSPFAAIVRVLLGGLVASVIVTIAMIAIDTQALHFSEYLMDENSRRTFTMTAGFFAGSAFVFGIIARGIANAADMLAGIYYSILFAVVIVIWHYGSFYVSQGADFGLTSPIVYESFMAYWNHLDALPPDNVLSIGVGIVIGIGGVYTLGSLSAEELARRQKNGGGLLGLGR